jgi:anti-sigma factor RsiW
MKTPTEDHDLIRWLDGEMTPAEQERFAARLESEPMLKADAESLRQLGVSLRAHLPAEMPVPHADFFNSQIHQRIAEEDAVTTPQAVRGGWLEWFSLPSFATAFAVVAAVVAAGVMIIQKEATGGAETLVLSTYAPNPNIQTRHFHSTEAQATVLMLDGVEAIPADRKIVGYHIERSEREQDVATTLYGKGGDVVLVVSEDSHNLPRLLSANTHP